MLEDKGYKVKLNVMDNQATKHIKKIHTKKECKLQLMEPHNKRLNASERAIQTWKDAFISALATTDPAPTVGPINPTSPRLCKPNVSLTNQSQYLSV